MAQRQEAEGGIEQDGNGESSRGSRQGPVGSTDGARCRRRRRERRIAHCFGEAGPDVVGDAIKGDEDGASRDEGEEWDPPGTRFECLAHELEPDDGEHDAGAKVQGEAQDAPMPGTPRQGRTEEAPAGRKRS